MYPNSITKGYNMKFRGKVTRMGKKYHIYIPQAWRKEAKALENKIAEIEVLKV